MIQRYMPSPAPWCPVALLLPLVLTGPADAGPESIPGNPEVAKRPPDPGIGIVIRPKSFPEDRELAKRLTERVAVAYPDPAPLEEVVKGISAATRRPGNPAVE